MTKAKIKSSTQREEPTIKELVDIIANAIARSNGESKDGNWGIPIATSGEVEQCNLIAIKLEGELTQAISVTVDKNQENGTAHKKHTAKFLKEKGWEKKWNTIDIIIEFEQSIFLLELKLLRPMGAMQISFENMFIKTLFGFDNRHGDETVSSILQDFKKLINTPSERNGGKKVKKFILAIYYPSHIKEVPDENEKEEERNKLIAACFPDRVDDINAINSKRIKKVNTRKGVDYLEDGIMSEVMNLEYEKKHSQKEPFEDAEKHLSENGFNDKGIKDIKHINSLFGKDNIKLMKSLKNELDINQYMRLFDHALEIFESSLGTTLMSKLVDKGETDFIDIMWDKDGLIKSIIAPPKDEKKIRYNLSYFFHKKVKVFGWEVK